MTEPSDLVLPASNRKGTDFAISTQPLALTLTGYNVPCFIHALQLALHYYSRFAFAQCLAPLLQKSSDPRVLSVLSAGVHSPYKQYKEDTDLVKNFSIKNAADAAGFYNDLAVSAVHMLAPLD